MSAADPIRIGIEPGKDVTLDHLQDQIEWYDRKSLFNQRRFKMFKMASIVAAALIPALSAWAPVWVTSALGVLIVVLEGLQQLNKYHENWIAYRSTCEQLKHEKFLYLATAGIYGAASDGHALLAERIESLVSQEHAKWASSQEQNKKVSGEPVTKPSVLGAADQIGRNPA
jgi:hypothetical protein